MLSAETIATPAASARPGVCWSSRYVLPSAIVILGLTLNLARVASVGLRTLPVMLGTLTATLIVALLVGRALGIPGTLRTLVGVGTGICGASAIAAVSGVIEASEVDIADAMSTIFVFNLIAVPLFPPIGHHLGLSQAASACGPAPRSTTHRRSWRRDTHSVMRPASSPSS
jgi:uncharacterized membrane protein YadS